MTQRSKYTHALWRDDKVTGAQRQWAFQIAERGRRCARGTAGAGRACRVSISKRRLQQTIRTPIFLIDRAVEGLAAAWKTKHAVSADGYIARQQIFLPMPAAMIWLCSPERRSRRRCGQYAPPPTFARHGPDGVTRDFQTLHRCRYLPAAPRGGCCDRSTIEVER